MKMTRFLGSSAWLAVLFGILFLFLVNGEALSATYYVSPSGNDANAGSTAAPFRTIQRAANIVNPGDVVIVRNGTYTDTDGSDSIVRTTRGGTSSAWVTFKAENKWGAVLDGQNQNNTGAQYCFIGGSASANYIRIEGFEMKNCDNGTFHNLGEHDIDIYNNYIHDIGRRTNNTMYGMTGSYTGSDTYNFTWDSNIFKDIGRLNPQTTPAGSEASCTTPPDYIFNGVPYGNQVHCYSHDHGLYLKSSYNTIVNNVFAGQFMSGFAAIFFDGSTNHTFINNTIAIGDNLHASGQIVFQWNNKPVTVRNNIFYGDASCAIKTNAGAQGVIENNVFYPTTT